MIAKKTILCGFGKMNAEPRRTLRLAEQFLCVPLRPLRFCVKFFRSDLVATMLNYTKDAVPVRIRIRTHEVCASVCRFGRRLVGLG